MKSSIVEGRMLVEACGGRWVSVDSTHCRKENEITESVWQLPQEIGSGRVISYSLGGDLTLTFSDIRLNRALNAHLEDPGGDVLLVFPLAGTFVCQNAFFKDGFENRPGCNSLYWSPEQTLTRMADEGEALRAVVVACPRARLGELENGQSIIRQEGVLFQHPNTSLMNTALQQILHCPFTGGLRRMFFESKALELISLKWAVMEAVQRPVLSPEQMRGVEKVRGLILKNIRNPPSLHKLARVAGMSHPVLNRCFKKVTGYTTFEFLRRQRLELSREMLLNSSMSLTEIAYAAGYASSSHFSSAFAACYKVQPNRYRKEALPGADQR